jgi:5,10-methylenetetrahydromethanopterin reductase
MRLALELGPGIWLKRGVEASIGLVQAAEAAGFDSVWASEDPDGWDAFSALSAIARNTESIALGTGVTNPYLRHPNLIAASVATLDHASNGRAFLGIGRGEPDWYRTAFGMDIGSPLKRVEETVDLLRQWWGPNQIASGSGEITVRAWRREFAPLSTPPIYIAATGPKMQSLAGRIGDGMRLNTLASTEFIRNAVRTARDSRAEVNDGRPFRIFANPNLTITNIERESEEVLERLKATVALIHVLPGMHQQLNGLEQQYPIDRILADVRKAMKTEEVLARGGSFADLRRVGDQKAARALIPTGLMRELAIVGQLDEVRTRVRALADLGVTDIFVNLEAATDPDQIAGLSAL